MKTRIRYWLYSRGYEPRSTISIPFGVDWHRDLKYFIFKNKEEFETVREKGYPHGNFFEIFTYLANFDFSVVSFYTDGVDDSGWIWGNVLFRLKSMNPSKGYVYSPHIPFSPHVRKS